MHALVVTVQPPAGDVAAAVQQLESRVIPAMKQVPGFVGGYWMAPREPGGQGLSVVLFEDEQSAEAASHRIQPPENVQLVSTEVRQVIASAPPSA